MQTSRFLARLVGPFLVVIALGLLVNGDVYQQMAGQFLQSLALIYVSGLLALVAGLAVVNTHNVWAGDWRIVITVLGWLGVIGGIVRIVFPQFVERVGTGMLAHREMIVGAWVVLLALGLWLIYEGYFGGTARSGAGARADAARQARKSRKR